MPDAPSPWPFLLALPACSMVGAVTGVGIVEAVSGRKPESSNTGNKRAFNW